MPLVIPTVDPYFSFNSETAQAKLKFRSNTTEWKIVVIKKLFYS